MSTREYKRGDKVWWARFRTEEVWRECPVCFGKLAVTVILGNNEHVRLPCENCIVGYDPPRGRIKEYASIADATQVTIDSVHVRDDEDGRTVSYHVMGNYVAEPEDLFDTQKEAQVRAEERAREYERERMEAFVKSTERGRHNRSYSRAIGYHRREAKRCRKTADRHDRAAAICKDRARPRKDTSGA